MKILVGLINLFFGSIAILGGVPYLLFAIPKLLKIYEEFGVDLPYSPYIVYLYPTILIIFGICNVLVGVGNLNLAFRKHSQLLYTIGIYLLVLSFLIMGFLASKMIQSTISPIYYLNTAISN